MHSSCCNMYQPYTHEVPCARLVGCNPSGGWQLSGALCSPAELEALAAGCCAHACCLAGCIGQEGGDSLLRCAEEALECGDCDIHICCIGCRQMKHHTMVLRQRDRQSLDVLLPEARVLMPAEHSQ